MNLSQVYEYTENRIYFLACDIILTVGMISNS